MSHAATPDLSWRSQRQIYNTIGRITIIHKGILPTEHILKTRICVERIVKFSLCLSHVVKVIDVFLCVRRPKNLSVKSRAVQIISVLFIQAYFFMHSVETYHILERTSYSRTYSFNFVSFHHSFQYLYLTYPTVILRIFENHNLQISLLYVIILQFLHYELQVDTQVLQYTKLCSFLRFHWHILFSISFRFFFTQILFATDCSQNALYHSWQVTIVQLLCRSSHCHRNSPPCIYIYIYIYI